MTILFHTPKGGVGKSLLAILTSEFFRWAGYRVALMDASGNPTAGRFIEGCSVHGRDVSAAEDPQVVVIDTKGVSSSAIPFVPEASLIVCPFGPAEDDAIETLEWYAGLGAHQYKAVMLVNRLRPIGNTKEQQAVIDHVEDQLQSLGGLLLYGLIDRPSIYPVVTQGLPANFFEMEIASESYMRAQAESRRLGRQFAQLLDLDTSREVA
ncbi:MAG: hypothetical protein AAF725_21335 [Acidobacteriota bacterium]